MILFDTSQLSVFSCILIVGDNTQYKVDLINELVSHIIQNNQDKTHISVFTSDENKMLYQDKYAVPTTIHNYLNQENLVGLVNKSEYYRKQQNSIVNLLVIDDYLDQNNWRNNKYLLDILNNSTKNRMPLIVSVKNMIQDFGKFFSHIFISVNELTNILKNNLLHKYPHNIRKISHNELLIANQICSSNNSYLVTTNNSTFIAEYIISTSSSQNANDFTKENISKNILEQDRIKITYNNIEYELSIDTDLTNGEYYVKKNIFDQVEILYKSI